MPGYNAAVDEFIRLRGCLLAIPFLGTVLLLPILVFERAYSIHYLAQYGSGYDVCSAPTASF